MPTESRSQTIIELLFILSLFLFVFVNQALGANTESVLTRASVSIGDKPSSEGLLNESQSRAESDLRELTHALRKITDSRLEASSRDIEYALTFDQATDLASNEPTESVESVESTKSGDSTPGVEVAVAPRNGQ